MTDEVSAGARLMIRPAAAGNRPPAPFRRNSGNETD